MRRIKKEFRLYEDDLEVSAGYFEKTGCFHRVITYDKIDRDFKLHDSYLSRTEIEDV